MNYISEYGQFIKLGNHTPKKLQGGLIPENKIPYKKIAPFTKELIDRDADTVSSLLPVGSLVIPRSLVNLVQTHFKINKSHSSNAVDLMPVIVQPKEMIVPSSQSKDVLSFLKKKGFTLPLKGDGVF